MEKVDLKKELPDSFTASADEFTVVRLPECNYLMVDGEGDPNSSNVYAQAIELLYGAAYTLKFKCKKEQLVDFVVAPLEGLWWADDMRSFETGDKDSWKWTMMIMVPPQVPEPLVTAALAEFRAKKSDAPVSRIRYESLNEGLVVQILFVGPYDAEGPTLARMHDEFMADNALTPRGRHHEVYLGDPRRTAPERLRTILRQPVDTAPSSS